MNSSKEAKLSSVETRILFEILFLRMKFHKDPKFKVLNERLLPIFREEFQESFENLKKKMLIESYGNFNEARVKITPVGLAFIRQLIEHELKKLME